MNKVVEITMEHPMAEVATKAIENGDYRIIAKGKEGKKQGIEPIVEKYGMYFYVAATSDVGMVYKGNTSYEDFLTAINNTINNAIIGDLQDVMLSIFGGEDKSEHLLDFHPIENGVYCVTNADKYLGSGIILCDEAMRKIYEKVGTFFLLPSSIHEVLIVPESNGLSWEEASEMVAQVNATEVAEDERLIDEALYFNGAELVRRA